MLLLLLLPLNMFPLSIMMFFHSRKACERLSINTDAYTDDHLDAYLQNHMHLRVMLYFPAIVMLIIFQQQFECFVRFRGLVAGWVENIIVLDRTLFLQQRWPANVTCLFDPAQSPRCFAITAVKNSA